MVGWFFRSISVEKPLCSFDEITEESYAGRMNNVVENVQPTEINVVFEIIGMIGFKRVKE